MSHTLKLTYGASTIDLNSGSNTLLEYVPQSPDLSTVDINSILLDGGERILTTRRNVTESARVLISSSVASDLQQAKWKVQQFLVRGERKQRSGAGSAAYINYSPDGVSGSYRSEIIGGKVELFDRSLDWRWTNARRAEL